MTSPGIVRLALAVSSIVTGGTIYYYISDGGDPKVAQEKAEQVKKRVVTESEKLQVLGVEGVGQARQILENAREKVMETSQTIMKTDLSLTRKDDSTPNVNQSDQNTNPTSTETISRHPYCHTCSGPRIWFFTDRLRLQRRFTPHNAEPPRD